jgi:hypothetical protein
VPASFVLPFRNLIRYYRLIGIHRDMLDNDLLLASATLSAA